MRDYYDAYDDSLDDECPACAKRGVIGIINNGMCDECGREYSTEPDPDYRRDEGEETGRRSSKC